MTLPSDKYEFTKEELMIILELLLEFFREQESHLEFAIENMIINLNSETLYYHRHTLIYKFLYIDFYLSL